MAVQKLFICEKYVIILYEYKHVASITSSSALASKLVNRPLIHELESLVYLRNIPQNRLRIL